MSIALDSFWSAQLTESNEGQHLTAGLRLPLLLSRFPEINSLPSDFKSRAQCLGFLFRALKSANEVCHIRLLTRKVIEAAHLPLNFNIDLSSVMLELREQITRRVG